MPIEGNESYYLNTRLVVPRLLKLFEAYDVAATWAAVGMLLAGNRDEWNHYSPVCKPAYHNPVFSAYHWYEKEEVDDRMVFAPELMTEVVKYPKQELGCHTFAHYYTLEKGHCEECFRADLQAAKRITREKFGRELTSLVFPRNQYDDAAIAVAASEGFTAVRTNPGDWYWRDPHNDQLVKRLFRTGDILVPLGKKTSFPLSLITPSAPGLPYQVPASRFFRPHDPALPLVNRWKLQRIKNEMSRAAALGEVYHLWWHPHNHGNHLEESLAEVEVLLEHYNHLHKKEGMESIHMRGLTKL